MHTGKQYNTTEYNCAHFVAEHYKEHLGVEIPSSDVFSREFVVWMRRNFTEIDKPEEHSLVLMVNDDDTYHVGVFHKFRVKHNFKPCRGSGSVCSWTMSSVTKMYKSVRFYKWSK